LINTWGWDQPQVICHSLLLLVPTRLLASLIVPQEWSLP